LTTAHNVHTTSARTIAPIAPAHAETQAYGHLARIALALDVSVAASSIALLNQLLADTLTLRDLYKKHHWQVAGPNFFSLHLLYDRHADNQTALADLLAERVQTLGGVSIAMAADVAEATLIPRPPQGREDSATQIARLQHAHEVVLLEARAMARDTAASGDVGTNDMIVADVIRANELQAWILAEHTR
jgi:starvation-inducible DNA-binding protein